MDDNKIAESPIWPLPKFKFVVDLSPQLKGIAFQDVSGLETGEPLIEYRKGDSKSFNSIKMPGLTKVGNITLRKGIFLSDDAFWDWQKQINLNTIKRETVYIKLLDESYDIVMQWQLNNAFPIKITSTDLKSDGNEVAIETLEIAYEQLIIANGK
jgi:phage tail-like protein